MCEANCAVGRSIMHPDGIGFPGYWEPCSLPVTDLLVVDFGDDDTTVPYYLCDTHAEDLHARGLLADP